ncbi:MAG: S1C family serine protease [Myxococcota bacterium]
MRAAALGLIWMLSGTAWAGPDAVVFLQQGSSTCAGAFVDERGSIVTAYHCIADGGLVSVVTQDGRRSRGRVVARRPAQDLALIAAPAFAGEPHLGIRDNPLTQGERVWAWGHPFGAQRPTGFLQGTLRWSVSEGVVSAIGPDAVQFTAAINPGNSGGPLVDEAGLLVGVVSRRLRGSGLGFATRASSVQSMLDDPKPGPALGGSLRASVQGSLWDGPGGSTSLGGGLEAVARDRLFVRGLAQFALRPRFDAVQFGQAAWTVGELHMGVRQRVGRGYWTARIDGYAGIAVVQTVRGSISNDNVRTATELDPRPIFGGRITLGAAGFDMGAVPLRDGGWAVRSAVVFQWPGRMGIF